MGCISVDIDLDDLINYLEESFYMGNLTVYVKLGEEQYYRYGKTINEIDEASSKYLKKLTNTIHNENDIYFQFDKKSIAYYRDMQEINRFRIAIFALLGIIFVLILIKLIKITFKPVMKSLDKLKVILGKLDKSNIDLENIDEFKQLELISNSLSKSFDKKIQSLIYYDELTKLPNRKMLYLLCNKMIEFNSKFALIFIDLNRFKYINDVFGHSAGDELLISFSERLQSDLEQKGTVTRYSGDEFIIIYHSYEGTEELEKFYNEKLLAEFSDPIEFNNLE